MRSPALVLALAAAAGAPVAAAQDGPAATTIRTLPGIPVRGSVAWLEVESDSSGADGPLESVEGDAAGEPLHFQPTGRGFRALVGIPLEGADTLEVRLRLRRAAAADTTSIGLALAWPALRSERLRVAPGMATLDSARQARVARELAQAREVSRRAHDTPRLWREFRAPRASRVTSVYGTAREFNGEITSRHLGTDFAGAVGAPVHAAARGVVALVADFYLAGRAVYLDHGAGLVTGYFHLSRADVAEGDTVAAGQRIGAVGRSGRVTGPHLHWIARYGTISVDPMSLLELTRTDTADRP